MANYARRDIVGGAVATTLNTGISSGDTSVVLQLATGWPTAANGNFLIVVDRGNAAEEKILCSARTGTTCTVASSGRGVDGTSAAAHSAGVSVEHCIGKLDIDEANYTVAKTVGLATAAGQILVVDAANSFAAVQGKTSGQVLMGNGTTVVSQALSGDVTVNGSGVTAIGSGKVTSGMILDATIATGDIADSAVTSAKIADGTIVAGDIASNAVTTAKILDNNVTLAKLATQADQTIVGNNSGGVAVPSALSMANVMAMLSGDAGADFSMNTHKITNVTDPASAQDAATKAYQDSKNPLTSSTWAPTFQQSSTTLSKTVTYAHYVRTGSVVTLHYYGTFTSAGPGGPIYMTLPITADGPDNLLVGGCRLTNGGNIFVGGNILSDSGTRCFADFSSLIASPNIANGNTYGITMSYLVA